MSLITPPRRVFFKLGYLIPSKIFAKKVIVPD